MPTEDFDVISGNANFQNHPNHADPLIRFSYQESLLRQRILSNQISEATGIYIDGVRYGWRYMMGCNNSIGGYCSDPNGPNDYLDFNVTIEDQDGDELYSSQYHYEGYYPDWQSEDVLTYAPESYHLGDTIASAEIEISGKDTGYWAGNYGPIVTDVYMNFIYRYDNCASDPLSDTSCAGYQEAYAEQLYQQQCTADPLFDSGCPGYSTAYHNQQCSINPLYDTSCPGYQQAWFDKKCDEDPLYSNQCPGYQQAYFDKQCSIDSLYDSSCPGYESAYLDKQCTADPLYSPECPGYEKAYFEKFVEPDQKKQEEKFEVVELKEEDFAEPEILDDPIIDDIVFEDTKIEVVELEPEIIFEFKSELFDIKIEEEPEVEEPTLEETIEAEIKPEPKPEPVEEEIAFDFTFNEEEEVDEESETEPSDNVDEQVEDTGDEESGEPLETDPGETEPDTGGEDQPRKQDSKKEKVRKLLAKKAVELANDLAAAVTLEEQQRIQNEIFAIQNYNYEFGSYSTGLSKYSQGVIPDNKKSPATANQRGLRNGLAQQLLHRRMVDMQWER